MKKKSIIIIFILAITLLTVLPGSISAQDIDVESMDNAQLLRLLQVIMQQLEEGETEETDEPLPAGTAVPVISVARFSDGKLFTIYENKKLIIERIPDDLFIQKNDGNGDTDKKKDTGTPTPDPHGCKPGCSYDCWTNIFGRQECGCVCG